MVLFLISCQWYFYAFFSLSSFTDFVLWCRISFRSVFLQESKQSPSSSPALSCCREDNSELGEQINDMVRCQNKNNRTQCQTKCKHFFSLLFTFDKHIYFKRMRTTREKNLVFICIFNKLCIAGSWERLRETEREREQHAWILKIIVFSVWLCLKFVLKMLSYRIQWRLLVGFGSKFKFGKCDTKWLTLGAKM